MAEAKQNFIRIDGFALDGTNSNVGEHHSFSTLSREQLPWLTNLTCVAHTANLPVKDIFQENTGLVELNVQAKRLNAYYRTSAVTVKELRK